jgi:hypothetical protein
MIRHGGIVVFNMAYRITGYSDAYEYMEGLRWPGGVVASPAVASSQQGTFPKSRCPTELPLDLGLPERSTSTMSGPEVLRNSGA